MPTKAKKPAHELSKPYFLGHGFFWFSSFSFYFLPAAESREKEILEQLLKPGFFTEFEYRALFFPAA